jgi:hypothetical protein
MPCLFAKSVGSYETLFASFLKIIGVDAISCPKRHRQLDDDDVSIAHILAKNFKSRRNAGSLCPAMCGNPFDILVGNATGHELGMQLA